MSAQKQGKSQLHLVALVVVLVVGTVGFFTGISRPSSTHGYGLDRERTQGERAPSPQEHNRSRFAGLFEALSHNRRQVGDEVSRPTEQEWNEAVKGRGENRAYNGAPPTIPHDIDQRGFPACLVCHSEGMVIEGRTAPAMSHETFASCVQCHVVSESPLPGPALDGGPPQGNTFEGEPPPGRGARAWQGAPPLIPHTTRMRERCNSCHGVLSKGLRTSHACQQSCRQCHGSSASQDQQPATSPPPLPTAPPTFE